MTSSRVRVASAVIAMVFAGGCAAGPMTPREQGTLGGAAIGASSGAIIGSASGDAAEGALIGGAIGAITGAIVGDSVQAEQERAARDQALTDELRQRNLDARQSDRGVVVNLPDVLFEFGRSELTPPAYRKVSTIADVLNSPGVSWRSVSIEGHTDSIGTEEANLRLSERRARAVADALAGQRVASGRLSTHGFGEAYPIAANVSGDGSDDPQGRALNRRVEVVILSEQGGQMQPQPIHQYGYPGSPPPPSYPPAPGYPPPAYPPPGYPMAPPPYGY